MKYFFRLLLIAIITPFQLFSQENFNLEMRSQLPFPGKSCANIWGYVDNLNNEYALLGTSTGLSIVDVTDPENPILRFNVNGVNNFWREVKTWGDYAYVTTEGDGGGLTIVDLSALPDTVVSRVYFGDGAIQDELSTIHALHIDNGYAYIYGSNIGEGGAIFLNLEDPWNPVFEGIYDELYIHDGIVWGDTLWASHIFDGFMGVIDVSDKSNPISLAQQETPNSFTHNTWLTSDRKTVLTTDEVSNSYLTAYRIDNINNIQELDRYQTSPGSGTIVHNTHVYNDYAVTSWYTEGVVIVDAHRPENLIPVAKNDFSPLEGDGFNGCWGVYPYLPSGNIIASDIEEGLFVLTPEYIRASYLEGIIKDSACGNPLENVTVSIEELDISEVSGFDGIFRTGTVISGNYTVSFIKEGYLPQTFENVSLIPGEVAYFDLNMFSEEIILLEGNVQNSSAQGIENAIISVSNSTESYQLTSNSDGDYSKCDLLPGEYNLVAGKWGFVTECQKDILLDNSFGEPFQILQEGYYDDFQFNFGWTVSGTATAGIWTRALPNETLFEGIQSNPGQDAQSDCNGFAFVTGNAAGGGPGNDDVDDGSTILRSPVMDLTTYIDPYLSFERWFFNGGGNSAVDDTLYIRLVSDLGMEFTLKKIVQDEDASSWVSEGFRIKDFVDFPEIMYFEVEASDLGEGHLVEAGIDLFSVIDSGASVNISNPIADKQSFEIFPNPTIGATQLSYKIEGFSLSDVANLRITDISGKEVLNEHLLQDSGQLSLPANLNSGMYFGRLLLNDRPHSVVKLIINN